MLCKTVLPLLLLVSARTGKMEARSEPVVAGAVDRNLGPAVAVSLDLGGVAKQQLICVQGKMVAKAEVVDGGCWKLNLGGWGQQCSK